MNWIKEIFKSVTTGEGLATKLIDTVSGYIPSKEDKARLEMEINKIARNQEIDMMNAEMAADRELNTRIKDLEGTAADLIQAGALGRIVLFLRGLQRPLWGYSTLYFIWRYYSGQLEHTQENYMLTLTLVLLVGGFLFGERAIKNVAPFIKEMLQARKN